MQVEGTVVLKAAEFTIKSKDGSKEWLKQDFVVSPNIGESYPDYLLITAFGDDNVKKLADIVQWDEVTVDYNAKVTLPENINKELPKDHKFWMNLNLWKIEKEKTLDDVSKDTKAKGGDDLPF